MNKRFLVVYLLLICFGCKEKVTPEKNSEATEDNPLTIFLIGDSTMANYALEADYQEKKYPKMGWGQVFQRFFVEDSLSKIGNIISADSVVVDDRALGGRSTRTFFQEGHWRKVYTEIEKNDLVMMQFGHNDASLDHPDRYVDIEGYKEFLRLFVTQTRNNGGRPIILTPVARNYPWKENVLTNVHGEYDQAAKDIAREMDVPLIDLNKKSMEHFTEKGEEYVSQNYFMNLPPGKFEAYPEGLDDNTHFQPAGAMAVAQLVFDGLTELSLRRQKLNLISRLNSASTQF